MFRWHIVWKNLTKLYDQKYDNCGAGFGKAIALILWQQNQAELLPHANIATGVLTSIRKNVRLNLQV